VSKNTRDSDRATAATSIRIRLIAACAIISLSLWVAEGTFFGPDAVGRGYKALIWGFALFSIFWLVIGSQSFAKRFVGSASPVALAYVRILCASVLLANTLWEDLASIALLPAAAAQPMGVAGPSILRPASELAFSKATGGKDEASTLLRRANYWDLEGCRSDGEHSRGLQGTQRH